MQNTTTCLPCEKPIKKSTMNKRAMGNNFKLQQQTRCAKKIKSGLSIAFMKELMDFANCCTYGEKSSYLINIFETKFNGYVKHALDKALELLRDCREIVRFKSKEERARFF